MKGHHFKIEFDNLRDGNREFNNAVKCGFLEHVNLTWSE